ncbi:BfmA/BtgA family mobilization protein [Flavobacterium sp. LHD-85]|uniref:BfmA/BtgA family mobilization protein n=1 Tax=Flavobacterium sp. LHD-85 TaxID=3071410 RepID=UPI0027DF514D|nr:BfmA/BtgA family mobilization protein [Flavobacterium sp. LHD-85]MDQ6527659.1 BfmA/BtgA family mobilization protein [Flavobacterium sp. LHD-85]
MKPRDTNSIRYPKETDDKIEKMAKALKRSKKELFCQMADYFYRSKKDPADPGDEMLKRELSSGISRILSFIRQQEKDFLLPLFTDIGNLKTISSMQIEILEGIGRDLLSESEKTAVLVKRSEQLINGIKHLLSKQKEKEMLKEQFSQLLDYYINQREEMGWTTAGTKKEELITHVRQAVKNL